MSVGLAASEEIRFLPTGGGLVSGARNLGGTCCGDYTISRNENGRIRVGADEGYDFWTWMEFSMPQLPDGANVTSAHLEIPGLFSYGGQPFEIFIGGMYEGSVAELILLNSQVVGETTSNAFDSIVSDATQFGSVVFDYDDFLDKIPETIHLPNGLSYFSSVPAGNRFMLSAFGTVPTTDRLESGRVELVLEYTVVPEPAASAIAVVGLIAVGVVWRNARFLIRTPPGIRKRYRRSLLIGRASLVRRLTSTRT